MIHHIETFYERIRAIAINIGLQNDSFVVSHAGGPVASAAFS